METHVQAHDTYENSSKRKRVCKHLVTNPTLDLEVYASNYSDHVKIDRLLFISECCSTLQVEALKLALEEIKKSTLDAQKYKSTLESLNKVLSSQNQPTIPLDSQWRESTQKTARDKSELLESELKTYKNNLIKESIRVSNPKASIMGMNDLAEHYCLCGDLTNALKCFNKMKEYCTTPKHTVDMYLNVARVSLEMGNFSYALSVLTKAEHAMTQTLPNRREIDARIKCESAIALVESGKFSVAADALLQIPYIPEHRYTKFLSTSDISVLAVLCSMASFDRKTLKQRVIENQDFKCLIENEPYLPNLIEYFYSAKYDKVSSILSKIEEDLYLDIYLHSQLEAIMNSIKQCMLIRYCIPFKRVSLDSMAAYFQTTQEKLEDQLTKLIRDGKINARVNRFEMALEKRVDSQQSQLYRQTLDLVNEFKHSSKVAIMRAQLIEHKLTLKQ